MEFSHLPVMADEVIKHLDIKENGIYFDGTAGGGGHSKRILIQSPTARVIAVDRDIEAVNYCKETLKQYSGRAEVINDNFTNIKEILKSLDIDKIDGALLDLGISSWQIDNFERGFSYRAEDFALDMRMDRNQTLTAETVINEYDEEQLYRIIRDYGEERFAKNIARNIIKSRQIKRITTCGKLSEIIYSSIPSAARRKGGNPSKRTFQAVRIEVNGELDNLNAIEDIIEALKSGGRLAVITFHSLEDRIVKTKINSLAQGCICPPKTPICICGNKPKVIKITKKPITAQQEEIENNKRSQSAKLRVCQKI
ncbi:MAG: 16S rRNA (cytosine(1402)-N(4))-methyltransferase RsmH [Clostridia bacterium]|nr:16S rRNA (cytosine(1402)-N(4))-methyltransferase RsmH [Clostridia bacterium]